MSYTKTLVPRSPSGINTIGEFDIFFPLQTKIADWYPTKPPLPLPPPPPRPHPPPVAAVLLEPDDDDDIKQGVLPMNVGPIIPPPIAHPIPIPPPPIARKFELAFVFPIVLL